MNPNKVSEKLMELEDRSQRNNLRTDGLTKNTNQILDGCEKKVQELLADKSNIQEDIEFD